MTHVVTSAVPPGAAEELATRLTKALRSDVAVVDWKDGPTPGGLLVLAPHELADDERRAALAAVDYSWVHVTSAGVDFAGLADVGPGTLLTRSWRCYAAPLAEYAMHAILMHEWAGAAPWALAAPAVSGHTAPVPESAVPDPGVGLWGCAVGIVGWGEVGRRLAVALTALGASVRVLSRTHRVSDDPRVRHTTQLDDVLDVDHLVLALPLGEDSRGILDREALGRARPGLHLVNVSRGELVDTGALLEHCDAGRLHATLDVTSPEPLPNDHPLRVVPTVRLSPHVAWRSRESAWAYVDDLVAVWQALARHEPVPGVVSGQVDRARALTTGGVLVPTSGGHGG